MIKMSFYNSIGQPGVAEFKDRGSKFLAYAFPFTDVKELKAIVSKLKKEHSKAVHFCFAYRIGLLNTICRSSDDGEPAGSAGKPILGQIDSKVLTDVLVVIVRYFGGTLLGVPGLINAYKTVTSLVLQIVPIIKKPILQYYSLQFDYTQINEVITILKLFDCVIGNQQNQLFCNLEIGVPKLRVDDVLHRLKNLRNVEISVLL